VWLERTAKSCGSGAAVLALSPREAKLLGGDGGKRAVLRGEHEVSRKAIAQGRPECSRCPVCSCAVLFAQIARETAGAASTRSSLRPLFSKGANEDANLGRSAPRECASSFSRHCDPVARNDGERPGFASSPFRGAALSKGETTHQRGAQNCSRNRPETRADEMSYFAMQQNHPHGPANGQWQFDPHLCIDAAGIQASELSCRLCKNTREDTCVN
jgi:hypothetical protein